MSYLAARGSLLIKNWPFFRQEMLHWFGNNGRNTSQSNFELSFHVNLWDVDRFFISIWCDMKSLSASSSHLVKKLLIKKEATLSWMVSNRAMILQNNFKVSHLNDLGIYIELVCIDLVEIRSLDFRGSHLTKNFLYKTNDVGLIRQ